MSVNELSLNIVPKTGFFSQKILGSAAIIGAPMLFMFFVSGGTDADAVAKSSFLLPLSGVVYIGGWICGAIGMFRAEVYPETTAAKVVFTLQMIFLTLAFLFSIQETAGVSYENGGGLFFGICDAGYPISHLFMLVVGVSTFRAGVWRGFARFAPFVVGLALPVTMLCGSFLGMTGGMIAFGTLTTVGLGTIGWKIFRGEK